MITQYFTRGGQQPATLPFLLFQNTALHLAAIHGHTHVVLCLLSHSEKQIHMNKKNHIVLDSTINAERKNVALAIASHNRSGRN